jgi:hypothetical protein
MAEICAQPVIASELNAPVHAIAGLGLSRHQLKVGRQPFSARAVIVKWM